MTLTLLSLFELSGQGSARAQQRDPRELEAKTACLAGRTERGIELLAQLYAESNDPTYIYNQARCFEQNGKAREAVTRFREYLRKSPGIAPDERAQVQARITELEAQQQPSPVQVPAAPAASTGGPAPSTPSAATPGTGAAPEPVATASAISTSSPSSSPLAGRGLRIAGVSAAALGVLGVVTGIYMHGRAVALSREVTDDAAHETFHADKYDDGRRAETLQWVGYSVGVAALLTGGVLYLLGANQTASETVTVMALPSRDGRLSASLRLVF